MDAVVIKSVTVYAMLKKVSSKRLLLVIFFIFHLESKLIC